MPKLLEPREDAHGLGRLDHANPLLRLEEDAAAGLFNDPKYSDGAGNADN